jgi:DNA-binding beta-propeller fold protein YncE
MNRRLLAVSFALACAVLALAVPAAASAAFGPLTAFGGAGQEAGQLNSAGSLAIASDGSVYVADFDNNRIDVFGPENAFRFAFGEGVSLAGGNVCTSVSGCRAGQGSGDAGAMRQPASLALGEDGNVYVADEANNRIDVFTSDGAFVRAFGKRVDATGGGDVCTSATGCVVGMESEEAGGLQGPEGLDVVGSTVYVADKFNNRIDVYGTDGTFRYTFGAEVNVDGADVCATGETCKRGLEEDGAGEIGNPFDVKMTPSGLLAVSENINDRFALFTPAGEFVRAMGREVDVETAGDVCTLLSGCQVGARDGNVGSMSAPTALAVDGAGDVFVADTDNNRIDEWSPDGAFVKAFGAGVLDGAESFEVCTAETGCLPGSATAEFPGAVPNPYGVAVDCQGGIWTTNVAHVRRVQRFGEAGTPLPTACPASPEGTAPTSGPASSTSTKSTPLVSTPPNGVKFRKLKLNKKKGIGTLTITVPGPGRVVLSGKGLAKATKTAKKAGLVVLPVKLVGKAKTKLAKVGKARVRADVTFTPTGGTPGFRSKSLLLRKTSQ